MFTLTPTAAEQIARAAAEQAEGRGPGGLPMLRVAAKHDENDGELVFRGGCTSPEPQNGCGGCGGGCS